MGFLGTQPSRVAQSVGHLTRKSGDLGSVPGLATYFFPPSAFSRRAVVSYWRKYVHEVLVNRLGGVSLPRKSVFRLTDRLDMTLDVYRGHKTTTTFAHSLSLSPTPLNHYSWLTIPPGPGLHMISVLVECQRQVHLITTHGLSNCLLVHSLKLFSLYRQLYQGATVTVKIQGLIRPGSCASWPVCLRNATMYHISLVLRQVFFSFSIQPQKSRSIL